MMTSLDEAREALRARQGVGARYDAKEAPTETLGWARLGTAYFARLLNDISDQALDAPSLVLRRSRRHVVAQVGYHARALTRLTQWAASGTPQPMYDSEIARLEQLDHGATLPARALRGLFRHAAVHLDVEWRDLDAEAWSTEVHLPGGRVCTAAHTPWLRAREIWLRAVDLDSGGSFLDMPPGLTDRLIADAAAEWSGPPLTVTSSDGRNPIRLGSDGGTHVSGAAADIARWFMGRGARRLSHDAPLPAIPPPDFATPN